MRLILLLIFLMAVCNGCQKAFKTDHGLKRHRVSCRYAKGYSATLLRMRHQLQKRINEKGGSGKRDGLPDPLQEAGMDNVSQSELIWHETHRDRHSSSSPLTWRLITKSRKSTFK